MASASRHISTQKRQEPHRSCVMRGAEYIHLPTKTPLKHKKGIQKKKKEEKKKPHKPTRTKQKQKPRRNKEVQTRKNECH